MQRHPTLRPLSRAHHDALILAQLLKKDTPPYQGLPSDGEGKTNYALDLFNTKLVQHFEQEERMLEKISGRYPEIDRLAREVVRDHQELTAAFRSLKAANDLIPAMDLLGRKLEQHIRKEERVLFPLIQEKLTPTEMDEIAPIIQ